MTSPIDGRPGPERRSAADVLFGEQERPAKVTTTTIGGRRPAPELAPEPGYPTRTPEERDLYGDTIASAQSEEMYPVEIELREVLRARNTEISDVLGLSQVERQARHNEFVAAVRESGIDSATAALIYNLGVDEALAAARGAEDDTEKYVQTASVEARREIREAYGDRAEDLLQRAERFVRGSPKLLQVLLSPRLHNNPQVVRAIVEHVRKNDIGRNAPPGRRSSQ